MTRMHRSVANIILLCSVATPSVLSGCSDSTKATGNETKLENPNNPGNPGNPGNDTGATTPVTPDMTVAIVDNSPAVHVFFVGRLDGALRNQLHFNNVTDSVPGNFPGIVANDAHLVDLASPSLSPDGSRLATVATFAPRQSEIVVTNADGGNAQVASLNLQIVVGVPTWSPDGRRLAYVMSTQLDTVGLDLFITDLETHKFTRLTTTADVKATAIRWSADGRWIYVARRTGTTSVAPNNAISEIVKVDASTGAMQTVASNVVGSVSSIAPSGTRVLVVRDVSANGGGVASQLVEVTLGAGERVVLGADAASARYVAASDEIAVVTTTVVAGGHTSVQQVVMNLRTKASLPVVGTGATTSVDAFARPMRQASSASSFFLRSTPHL